jgi:hypothetical protein
MRAALASMTMLNVLSARPAAALGVRLLDIGRIVVERRRE